MRLPHLKDDVAYFFTYCKQKPFMSNIIYLLSVFAAVTWSFCYALLETSSVIHIFLLLSFIGIAVSLYMDKDKEISNQ
jgi:hypothetical protein